MVRRVLYIKSIITEDELSIYKLENKWNDYIGVQKEVINVLRAENYFDAGSVNNKESGMEVRITAKGIKETLGNGNRFQTLPRKLKIYKVSVIRSLPELIETGCVIADDFENSHSKDGYKYAYINNNIEIDGNVFGIRIAIKKKIGANHFWIHNIDEYKKNFELLSPSQKTVLKETQSSC